MPDEKPTQPEDPNIEADDDLEDPLDDIDYDDEDEDEWDEDLDDNA